MSIYNMMHGFNRNALLALSMLNLESSDFGRFRDAWIEEDGKHISVFTRCGGGNREGYGDMFEEMSKHPEYAGDFDDDFDCTYATIQFKVPAKYLELTERMKPKSKEPSLLEKTNSACDSLKKGMEADKDIPKEKVDIILAKIKEALDLEKMELVK